MMIQNTSGLTRLEHQGLLMKHVKDSLPNFQVLNSISYCILFFFRTKLLRLLLNCLQQICNIAANFEAWDHVNYFPLKNVLINNK